MSDNVGGRRKLDFENRDVSSRETASASSDISVYKSSDEGSVRYERSNKSSIYKSSDAFFAYNCDPCSFAGDHLEAEGFCAECGEYLCGTCFRSHSRGKATRNHRLLNKDDMPLKSAKLCDPCKTAGEEHDAVGYCQGCQEYLCDNCFESHSRNKATKHHYLIGKDEISIQSESAVTSSVAEIDIQKGNGDYQNYDEKYSHVRKLKVKTSWREKKCYINGMTLVSNTELVLIDSSNTSVKLFDMDRNAVKDILVLKTRPLGLTTIPVGQVAVALPHEYAIQIITVAKKLFVQRNITTQGMCLDIEFRNGKLFTSHFQPVKFQILQTSGKVNKTINPDSEVRQHCETPCNIAVSLDESVIFISDWESKKVLSMDMEGHMMSLYLDELLTPNGIAISLFGSLYLCDGGRSVVYKMKSDLKEAFVILGPQNNHAPYAMCFDATKQSLYIRNASAEGKECNYINMFEWQ